MRPDEAQSPFDGPAGYATPAARPADVPPPSPFSREGLSLGGLAYQGPPPMTPPPAGWRPSYIVELPPPRRLPSQNHTALDDEETRARLFTYGLSAVAGALLLVVVCALLGRVLF